VLNLEKPLEIVWEEKEESSKIERIESLRGSDING
jgi:hypothetical protein